MKKALREKRYPTKKIPQEVQDNKLQKKCWTIVPDKFAKKNLRVCIDKVLTR
jgi:hypothetical protein